MLDFIKGIFSSIARLWIGAVLLIGIGGTILTNGDNPLGTNAFEGMDERQFASNRATPQQKPVKLAV